MLPPTPPSSDELQRALARVPDLRARARRRRQRRHVLIGAVAASLLALGAGLSFAFLPGSSPTTVHVISPQPATTPTNFLPPPTTTSTTTTTLPAATTTALPDNGRTVLPPASVPPVSDECTISLFHDADGNVSPLLCPWGGVNTLAWQSYERGWVNGGPETWSRTMALGRAATATQVWQAMCADYASIYGTNPLTVSAETLAAAYYGWKFSGPDPVTNFEMKGCPAR